MSNVYPLFQLGMDLEAVSSTAQEEVVGQEEGAGLAGAPEALRAKDYFIERDGVRCAGTHLIIDLWEAERLDDLPHIEATLRACVAAAGATLLHIHLHHFTPNMGVSGVAVLAESHISIHTWPENGYAALDVFMCGAAQPHETIEVLRTAFRPARVAVSEHLRGRVPEPTGPGPTGP